MRFGEAVDDLAPNWLKEYLAAKRAVESELAAATELRPVVLRPSLIWNWKKLDVLPIIPLFNLAAAIGVPFVDKTVRVEALAKAAVASLLEPKARGATFHEPPTNLPRTFRSPRAEGERRAACRRDGGTRRATAAVPVVMADWLVFRLVDGRWPVQQGVTRWVRCR